MKGCKKQLRGSKTQKWLVVLTAVAESWLMCKLRVHCGLHIAPSGYHNGLPRHIAKQWTANSKNGGCCLRRRTGPS